MFYNSFIWAIHVEEAIRGPETFCGASCVRQRNLLHDGIILMTIIFSIKCAATFLFSVFIFSSGACEGVVIMIHDGG